MVSQTLVEEFPHGDVLGSQRKGAKKGKKTLLPAAAVRAREDKACIGRGQEKGYWCYQHTGIQTTRLSLGLNFVSVDGYQRLHFRDATQSELEVRTGWEMQDGWGTVAGLSEGLT